MEFNFGHWDGKAWSEIPKAELDAWCIDFTHYAPGGAETVEQWFNRVAWWLIKQGLTEQETIERNIPFPTALLVVGHAGWINAARLWLVSRYPYRPKTGQRL